MHRAIIDAAVGEVCGNSPLGGTRDVGHTLTLGELDARGDVEVVEDVECLHDGLLRCGEFGSRGLEEGGTYKSRRGSHIAGYAMQSAAATKGGESEVADFTGMNRTGKEIGIVIEIGDMPIKSGGIG